MIDEPSTHNNYLSEHIALLAGSYEKLTGRSFTTTVQNASELAKIVYTAHFALLSHNIASDPLFNYANLTAQHLFDMDWQEFITTPSRLSAEQPNREERERLLERVKQHGFINDYSGTRIAADGRRFFIEQATVWNVVDKQGIYRGQAAMFSKWKDIDCDASY